jgi:sensor c-di-GMP phosphodiesterase-like protein
VAGLGTDATMAPLIRGMVQVVNDLGIDVVAEGIEHAEQLELLRDMGCAFGQGGLLAGQMTASEVARLARDHGARDHGARDHGDQALSDRDDQGDQDETADRDHWQRLGS